MAGRSLWPMEVARVANTVISMDPEDNNSQKPKAIQLRDFFWDRVINTMIVLVFGVTSIQAIVSYFNGGGLKCVIAENHSISVLEYINQLCQKDVPNYGKFYNISLYAETALLSGLQVFWSQIWSGRIQSFKSTVASMSIAQKKITGQFETSDYNLARYLERSLESTALTWTYMLKIGGQITVCALGIGFLIFYPKLEFSYGLDTMIVFECNNDTLVNGQWPLVEQSVHCVLTELSNQQILRWFNFTALVVIIFSNIIATFLLAYSLYYFHLLDYKRVARFILYTGLRRDHYPEYHYKSGCNPQYEMCGNGCTHSCAFLIFSLFWWCKTSKCNVCLTNSCCCCDCCDTYTETKLIPFDMTFLIVKLHGTDSKMGGMLLNVLIDNYLDYLIKNECSKSGEPIKKTTLGSIIKESCKKIANGRDIKCILVTSDNGSLAYLFESYAFLKKMICINFNSVISATNKSETDRFHHSNPLVYQLPSKIWSTNEKMYEEIETHVKTVVEGLYADAGTDDAEECATVIVLAPLSDEVYRYTHGDLSNTKQRMKSLFQQIESVENVSICGRTNRLYLLGVLPKAIANKADVSNEFCGGKEDSFEWLTDASTQYYNNQYEWKTKDLGLTDAPKDEYEVEGVTYKVIGYEAKLKLPVSTVTAF